MRANKQEIIEEMKRQMMQKRLLFKVESLEEALEILDDAADYIEDVYSEEPTIQEKIAAWIEDTENNFPEMFV